MTKLENSADLAGRILIAALFLVTGFAKIAGYTGTQAYMASQGVPGALLPLVIALELGGGLVIVAGYRTRIVAFLLAGFSIVAALIFHSSGDQTQQLMLMKNFAIAGGFLFLVARGAGEWSLDARRAARTAPGELLRRQS